MDICPCSVEDEMYRSVISSHEEKLQQLVVENHDLRLILAYLLTELSALTHNSSSRHSDTVWSSLEIRCMIFICRMYFLLIQDTVPVQLWLLDLWMNFREILEIFRHSMGSSCSNFVSSPLLVMCTFLYQVSFCFYVHITVSDSFHYPQRFSFWRTSSCLT